MNRGREFEALRLATLLQITNDAIIVQGLDGSILVWNRGAERLFGYTETEALTMNIRDLMPPELRHPESEYFKRMNSGQEILSFETERLAKDGRKIDTWLTVTRLNDENGRPVEIATTERDASERKRLMAEILNTSEEERLRISRDLHDAVSQRLTGAAMMTKALEARLKQTAPAEAEPCAEIGEDLQEAVQEIRRVIQDISPLGIEKNGLTQALRDLAAKTSRQTGIECRFVSPDSIAIDDHATENHLLRIAQEAAHNAIKHARAQNVTITLDEFDTTIRLIVADDGVGVPAHPRRRGEGLGMRIMEYRASLIGGRLEIEQAPKKGTRVICTIPRSKRGVA